MFCEVSAKTRENVRKPFVEIVDVIVKSSHLTESFMRRSGGNIITGLSNPDTSSCAC
jgi:Ras-related protein Rab-18